MSAPAETPRPRIWVWPFLALLWLYKFLLSPLLHLLAPGAGCRYRPTCSEYAVDALRRYGLLRGTWLSLRRFLDCHPWGHFGYDPVPPEWPGWWRRRKHYYAHGAEAPENQACDGPHAGSTHLP